MFSAISRRLTPAGVVSVVALVFAMLGGAYAASGGLTGKQKKEVKTIAKSFQGKGPTGPQGPAGANGKDGANGTNGANGKDGTNGTNGKDGTSAKATSFSGAKGGCTEGGIEVASANPVAFVCNGNPWTAGGTLPKGATETGVWSVVVGSPGFETSSSSFNIPLSSAPAEAKVIFIPEGEEEEFETECPGTADAPAAAEGYVCFYEKEGTAPPPGGKVITAQGVTLLFFAAEGASAIGSWAVTAE